MLSLTTYWFSVAVFAVFMLYIGEAIWRTRVTFKHTEAKLSWLVMGCLIYGIILAAGIAGFVYCYNKCF